MNEIASPAQLRMSFARWALVTVPAIVFLGFLMGRVSNSGFGNPWYDALTKPALQPPGWAFGAAWTVLYIMLGLALAMILNARGNRYRGYAITLFAVAFISNLAWSPLFFTLKRPDIALIEVVFLWASVLVMCIALRQFSVTASWMIVPYLAWVSFAAILNGAIVRLNPRA